MEGVQKRQRNFRKRPITENDPGEDETVVRKSKTVKLVEKQGVKKSSVFAVEVDKSVQKETDQGATRQLETETEFDRDARARREKKLKAESGQQDGKKTYKGLTGYVDYASGLKKEKTIAQEKTTGAHGPLRGSNYIRMSARFDYQPDVCKDYKETGFCSFGDSCKFLHDRGDYKSGWELEKEWEEERLREREALRKLAEGGASSEEEQEGSGDDDDLPFACYICREPWEKTTTPVVTPCKHYFCETCALKSNTKSPKCTVCEKATLGIFNVAHDVLKRMKKRKE